MKKCWICGNIANSGEHKFKASDLKRTYGKKFDGYYIGEEEIEINSYKEKVLKFPKIICQNCNENRTRPHDDAYDIFIKYTQNNYDKLLNFKVLDFNDIYGNNWREMKIHLYRYFAKHAGCKIETFEFSKNTNDLAEFIKGDELIKSFTLKFELKILIKFIHEQFNKTNKYVHLFNGPTIYFGLNESELNFGGWLSNNWLTTNWIYSPTISNSKKIDFNNQYEELHIKDLENYQESFYKCKNVKSLICYIEYGSLNSLERRIEHFKEMID